MTTAGNIHIIDDNQGIRDFIDTLLKGASFSTFTYGSAEEFLERFVPGKPGCIVLDLRMPGIGGLGLLQRLRKSDNKTPIIVISGDADIPRAILSMKLGAIDFLQKPFKPTMLVATVSRALQVSIDRHAGDAAHEAIQLRFSTLTARERELLGFIASGKSNKQIAMQLFISPRTVACHRANLMAKTHAINGADLARLSTIAGVDSMPSMCPACQKP